MDALETIYYYYLILHFLFSNKRFEQQNSLITIYTVETKIQQSQLSNAFRRIEKRLKNAENV